MEICIKTYQELTKDELHEVLRLRNAVFVVEQDCVYQDIDGKDYKAYHALGIHEGEIIAYARLFRPGDYFENASIGRVLVSSDQRKKGWANQLMKEAMNFLQDHFSGSAIELSAQTYLLRFYGSLGFQSVGEEYLEDGIPHIKMTCNFT